MRKIYLFGIMAACMWMTSCVDDANDTIILEDVINTDIPSDADASANPDVYGENTVTIPNVQYTTVDEDGVAVIRLDMTGIQDKSTLEWIRLLGTGEKNQNIWLEIDGKPKGIKVYNTSDNEEVHSVPVDLVFTVDNSGSMSEEADAIARDIINWAQKLASSNLDIKFGCVGYGGNVGENDYGYLIPNYGVSGALNMTSVETLSNYLNRSTGVNRTKGFEGSDKSYLSQKATESYDRAGGECGVQAIRFAHDNFNFRDNANRIYLNFTDDGNFHGEDNNLRVNYFNSEKWSSINGTIHTIFSGSVERIVSLRHADKPWLMSEYTGGTTMYTDDRFTGVSLSDLPVTDAMRNSYIIRFTNIEEFLDGKSHQVKITVKNGSGSIQAVRVFNVVFSKTPVKEDGNSKDSKPTWNGGFPENENGFSNSSDSSKQLATIKQLVGKWVLVRDNQLWSQTTSGTDKVIDYSGYKPPYYIYYDFSATDSGVITIAQTSASGSFIKTVLQCTLNGNNLVSIKDKKVVGVVQHYDINHDWNNLQIKWNRGCALQGEDCPVISTYMPKDW